MFSLYHAKIRKKRELHAILCEKKRARPEKMFTGNGGATTQERYERYERHYRYERHKRYERYYRY